MSFGKIRTKNENSISSSTERSNFQGLKDQKGMFNRRLGERVPVKKDSNIFSVVTCHDFKIKDGNRDLRTELWVYSTEGSVTYTTKTVYKVVTFCVRVIVKSTTIVKGTTSTG